VSTPRAQSSTRLALVDPFRAHPQSNIDLHVVAAFVKPSAAANLPALGAFVKPFFVSPTVPVQQYVIDWLGSMGGGLVLSAGMHRSEEDAKRL
jgi:hypothetical protein